RPSGHRRSRALRHCRLAIPSSGRNIAAASAHAALRGAGREGRVRPTVEHSHGTRSDRTGRQASYGRLLAGINGVQGMVPAAGMARLDSTQLLLGAGGLVIQSDFDIEPGTTTRGGGGNLTSALPLLRGSSSTTWRATGSWAWR